MISIETVSELSSAHATPAIISSTSTHVINRMQQLYRCTSWWWANYPAKQPILVCRKLSKLLESYFVSNYIKLLQDTIGLQVVQKLDDENNPLAVVRSKEIGKWEFDIDLTDFAFLEPQQQLRASFFSKQASDNTQTAVIDSTCRHTNLRKERFPRIAILNRKLESGRHLLNANSIAYSMEATYGPLVQSSINNNVCLHHPKSKLPSVYYATYLRHPLSDFFICAEQRE
jgi:hypothetical protein